MIRNDNRDKIRRAMREAYKETVMLIGIECTKEISRVQQWEGFNDLRDIVDTGQLRASQQIVFTDEDTSAEIQYNTEYAAPVHEGAVIKYKNGNRRTIKPRPWIRAAMRNINFRATMSRLSVRKMRGY